MVIEHSKWRSRMDKKYGIVVLTDSRGRGLKETLESQQEGQKPYKILVCVKPGAKLANLILEAEDYLQGKKFKGGYTVIQVYLLAGICDYTSIIRVKGLKCIEYKRIHLKINILSDEIKRIYELHKGKIIVSTIPPACIEQSYTHRGLLIPEDSDQTVKVQQANLLEDLENINKIIIQCNKECAVESLDLAVKVFSDSKKKREKRRRTVFAGKRLFDGVHATPKLELTWNNLASAVIIRGAECSYQKLDQRNHFSDSQEESVDEEDRSHKRRRKHFNTNNPN